MQLITAAKSCTCIAGLLLMALQMTFGGAPNPSQWSDISEVVTDLANDITRERVGHRVFLSREPLGIVGDPMLHEVGGHCACNCQMKGILVSETGSSNPPRHRRTVPLLTRHHIVGSPQWAHLMLNRNSHQRCEELERI